jgi:predicted nucleic acid-binding protein
MLTLLDVSLLAALQRGNVTLSAAPIPTDDDIAISSITASDLLQGVYAARTAEQRGSREAYIERLLELVPVIAFDQIAARIHAHLRADLAASAISVAPGDLMIGATAIAHGGRVATHDLRTFESIPGLALLRC